MISVNCEIGGNNINYSISVVYDYSNRTLNYAEAVQYKVLG